MEKKGKCDICEKVKDDIIKYTGGEQYCKECFETNQNVFIHGKNITNKDKKGIFEFINEVRKKSKLKKRRQ